MWAFCGREIRLMTARSSKRRWRCPGNLHANFRLAANDRAGLETLCRYMGRPPLSADRLAEISDGNVALRLKRPWSDRTTHLVFSATELIEKLIPLMPRPRAHLTRYHGVLAPASGWRSEVVLRPDAVDVGSKETSRPEKPAQSPADPRRRHYMPWADLLKRVFLVDALACPRCGGPDADSHRYCGRSRRAGPAGARPAADRAAALDPGLRAAGTWRTGPTVPRLLRRSART
jgi:hypothetical protein